MCARAKGHGCLVKRGNVYQARWVVDGQVFTRTTGCSKKKDAAKKLEEFVHPYQVSSDIERIENLQSKIKVLEGESNRTPKDKAVRLNLILDCYEKDINQSPLTSETDWDYTCKCRRFAKFFPDKTYAYQISEKDAEAFMLSIKDKVSLLTYNCYLKILRRVFRVVMKHDTNIRKNPFEKIKELKITTRSFRRELSQAEINKLINTAYEIDNDIGLFFKIGAYTGMRRQDVVKLKRSDIDIENRMIRKLPSKTKKTGIFYRIPIVDELYDSLKNLKIKADEYVFPHFASLRKARMSDLIRDVFAKSEIPIFITDKDGKRHYVTGYHAFRHTLASRLHRCGTPINQIKTILGHSKIEMSLYYAHVNEADLHMPDFTDSTKTVQVQKEIYAKVMSYGDDNDTFNDALEKMIDTLNNADRASEEFKKAELERKAKEEAELDAWLDEFFDEDGKPIPLDKQKN